MGEYERINELVAEAATMRQDINDAAVRCRAQEASLAGLESRKESLLREDAAPAMDALLELVKQIEFLHQFTLDQKECVSMAGASALEVVQARAPLVNTCKSQCLVAFDCFQSLSNKAKDLMRRFTDLSTDFTYDVTSAQTRIDKLQNLEQIAETLRNGIENERNSLDDQRRTAEAHVEQARDTMQAAESKRESMEEARVVRNIFTLGIGEPLDLFDLNKDIKDAEETIQYAQQNLQECEESIQKAMSALRRIEEETASLNTLRSSVHDEEKMLQESVTHCQGLRTHTIDLTNASLDVSLFVGKLAAKSETLEVNHDAQAFAQGVLNFGKVMVSEGRLSGLLVLRDPGALQGTLNMIVQGDVEGEGHAIEDMM